MRAAIRLCAVAIVFTACSSSTEPLLVDFDIARTRWVAAKPTDYTFEFAEATSWTPKTDFVRVHVVAGNVVAVTDLDGKLLPQRNAPSIEEIWQALLKAYADDELNSAVFTQLGVPVESDFGPWALDGGVHYSVRRFAESR